MNSPKRILVVDDEQEIIEVVFFLLKKEGYEMTPARNGMEALEKIQQQEFAGVICDLAMPKMNGITLLKKVRETHNFLPFIFLSGHAGAKDEHEMINYGAYEVVQKPHVNKVIPALEKLLKASRDVKTMETSSDEAREFLEILHSSGKKTTD